MSQILKNHFVVMAFIATLVSGRAHSAEAPVAVVNGEKISKAEFEQAFEQNKLFVSDRIVTKEKVLNDLINRALGIQLAKKNKLDHDPTVKSKMEDVLYHAHVSKELGPKIESGKIVVSDSEIENYYKDHPEYRTAHVLLRVRVGAPEAEIKSIQEAAFKIYQDITKDPSKFSELAALHSQSSVAANGGDMGFQPAARMPSEYYKAIHGKETGHITVPVRTQFGYHIIKVLGKKDFKSVAKEIYQKIIYDIKRDEILDEYFAKMRKGATITVNQKNL